MSRDYYAVLGVPRDASEAVIRDRFRQLARERHPDRFRGAEKARAEEEFQATTEAFNVLMNPERRQQHDAELAAPKAGASSGIDQEQLTKVYMQRGVKAYKEKNYREAADSFDRATRSNPVHAPAWYSLALACSRDERYMPKAREAIIKACDLDSMNETYLRAAGRIFAHSGDRQRAERYYNEALKWSANDPEIQRELDELMGSKKGRFSLFGKP